MTSLVITCTAAEADGSSASASVTVQVAALPAPAAALAGRFRPELSGPQPKQVSGLLNETPAAPARDFRPPTVTQAKKSTTYVNFTGGYR